MEIKESDWPEKKSPRDFKPWESLMSFYEPINGLYMYEQAAREIADAQGMPDAALEALESEMRQAIRDGKLKIRSRHTSMETATEQPDSRLLWLVTVGDVNHWLESKGVSYRWEVQSTSTEPGKRWTAAFTDEVRAFRAKHTEKQTAEKFGVSGTLIRRKLAQPKKAKAQPFSGLGSRAK